MKALSALRKLIGAKTPASPSQDRGPPGAMAQPKGPATLGIDFGSTFSRGTLYHHREERFYSKTVSVTEVMDNDDNARQDIAAFCTIWDENPVVGKEAIGNHRRASLKSMCLAFGKYDKQQWASVPQGDKLVEELNCDTVRDRCVQAKSYDLLKDHLGHLCTRARLAADREGLAIERVAYSIPDWFGRDFEQASKVYLEVLRLQFDELPEDAFECVFESQAVMHCIIRENLGDLQALLKDHDTAVFCDWGGTSMNALEAILNWDSGNQSFAFFQARRTGALGGSELMTSKILDLVERRVKSHHPEIHGNPAHFARFMSDWATEINNNPRRYLDLSTFQDSYNFTDPRSGAVVVLTREEVAECLHETFRGPLAELDKLIRHVRKRNADKFCVFISGGSSKSRYLRDLIEEVIGDKVEWRYADTLQAGDSRHSMISKGNTYCVSTAPTFRDFLKRGAAFGVCPHGCLDKDVLMAQFLADQRNIDGGLDEEEGWVRIDVPKAAKLLANKAPKLVGRSTPRWTSNNWFRIRVVYDPFYMSQGRSASHSELDIEAHCGDILELPPQCTWDTKGTYFLKMELVDDSNGPQVHLALRFQPDDLYSQVIQWTWHPRLKVDPGGGDPGAHRFGRNSRGGLYGKIGR